MSSPISLIGSTLVSQGAEAKVYRSTLHDTAVLLKHRFVKTYRNPVLDISLTRARVAAEARALMRCLRVGVSVPSIIMVDAPNGVLGIEWIEGKSVRRLLPGGAEEQELCEDADNETEENEDTDPLAEFCISQDTLMELIGAEIAKMHQADIIHGDLTTSNMMLRHPSSFAPHSANSLPTELVLIDFGLSYHSTLVEDKAVDLYVLERAFSSTHPDSSRHFETVLRAYGAVLGRTWPEVAKRLDDVRLRGRKRSMLG